MKDYSDLEGTKITYENNVRTFDATVAGCDYDIGITIVDDFDNEPLCCLNGPSSPRAAELNPLQYKKTFISMVAAIRKKYYSTAKFEIIDRAISGKTSRYHSYMSSEYCAFSQ